jgi:hypothetical protein
VPDPSRSKTMMVDINSRAETERALREAEEFATRLIACSQDCIKMLDLEGRLLWMNEGGMQALEICDFSPLENASWIDFWGVRTAKPRELRLSRPRRVEPDALPDFSPRP